MTTSFQFPGCVRRVVAISAGNGTFKLLKGILTKAPAWPNSLVKFAAASLEAEDRRLRLLYSTDPNRIRDTPAICLLNEHEITGVVVAAIASRLFSYGDSLVRESPYPQPSRKRADFAVKEPGPGKNWAYVEVKRYSNSGGKRHVGNDAEKLRDIQVKVQRWLLLYRVASPSEKKQSLTQLLEKNYPDLFREIHTDDFRIANKEAIQTNFELAFCRLKNC